MSGPSGSKVSRGPAQGQDKSKRKANKGGKKKKEEDLMPKGGTLPGTKRMTGRTLESQRLGLGKWMDRGRDPGEAGSQGRLDARDIDNRPPMRGGGGGGGGGKKEEEGNEEEEEEGKGLVRSRSEKMESSARRPPRGGGQRSAWNGTQSTCLPRETT